MLFLKYCDLTFSVKLYQIESARQITKQQTTSGYLNYKFKLTQSRQNRLTDQLRPKQISNLLLNNPSHTKAQNTLNDQIQQTLLC